MRTIAQACVGIVFGLTFQSISDTFASGVIAGALAIWINFSIAGLLKSEEEFSEAANSKS